MGLDLAIVACATLNLTYFLHRLVGHREQAASHRVAALALALVSLGAIVESLLFLASVAAAPPDPPLASVSSWASWTLARAIPLAGTAFVSVLVVRRVASR